MRATVTVVTAGLSIVVTAVAVQPAAMRPTKQRPKGYEGKKQTHSDWDYSAANALQRIDLGKVRTLTLAAPWLRIQAGEG